MLIGVPGDAQLSRLIRDFKRITARMAKIDWQRKFFDYRCGMMRAWRKNLNTFVKIQSARVRAGLITQGEEWPYATDASDLDSRTGVLVAHSTGD
jgi:hypothetical protein